MTNNDSFLPPSKRAARRIIQRAFVLTGRDRQLRQHIREARLTTLWNLEDWELVWTVIIDRGKIEFERRPAKHPDLTFCWPTADEFFSCASLSIQAVTGLRSAPKDEGKRASPDGGQDLARDPDLRRIASILLKCFYGHLAHVLRNPVDGAGESLL